MMPAERFADITLMQLLDGFAAMPVADDVPVPGGIALDSRKLETAGVFAALAGQNAHGLDYLDDVIATGAAAVLCDDADPRAGEMVERRLADRSIALVRVPDLGKRIAPIAARYHGEPAREFVSVTAVTGTDGKTSVSHFLANMLNDPGAPAAVAGTLGHGVPGQTREPGLTTPDAVQLQAMLRGLVDDGYRHLALEASSHGLAQYRLDGTHFDVAVLTQLGRDHLDYHADAQAYARAKARLFAWPGLKAAVLNLDDSFGATLHARYRDRLQCIGYSRHGEHAERTLSAVRVMPRSDGIELELAWEGESAVVHLPLLGLFNADNAMAAAGALLALGHEFTDVVERLARVVPVAGRMELFRTPGTAGVVVDYAHTPGALAAALAAIRAHARGAVWCIFGAGGDRDAGKRPLMGRAAAEAADHVIVTDDNPRSESPETIVADIVRGMPRGTAPLIEHDRGQALAHALAHAAPEDLILFAGKGHETTQTRGTEILPWSDRDAVRQALAERLS